MKEIIIRILEFFSSEPEKQNKIQDNKFNNKGSVKIKQENNSKTVNNNFVVYLDNQVRVLDEEISLKKNRELFLFVIFFSTPLIILSLLQLKFHFNIGSWMIIILIVSVILGLRFRVSLDEKLEFFEQSFFKKIKLLEIFMQVSIPTKSKQGFLFAFLLFSYAGLVFYAFLLIM